MRSFIIICLVSLFGSCASAQQKTEVSAVKTTIQKFAKAGDKQDAELLSTYLDDNYRIVMNRMFGSKQVEIMPKTVYLQKIKNKEYGGDKRKVTVSDVVINKNVASAKVVFEGQKMSFSSIIVLVKDGGNNWKLVSEVPVLK